MSELPRAATPAKFPKNHPSPRDAGGNYRAFTRRANTHAASGMQTRCLFLQMSLEPVQIYTGTSIKVFDVGRYVNFRTSMRGGSLRPADSFVGGYFGSGCCVQLARQSDE